LKTLNLLPQPRSIQWGAGFFVLPRRVRLHLDAAFPVPVAETAVARLQSAGRAIGMELVWGRPSSRSAAFTPLQDPVAGNPLKSSKPIRPRKRPEGGAPRPGGEVPAQIRFLLEPGLKVEPEYYRLAIGSQGVQVICREAGGLRAAVATLRQLLREYGRRLPQLTLRDWPDFARRGFMLDISRGRVPNLATLLDLADHLADFKINELQLYTEHTFAYRRFKPVWQSWGALTGADIKKLVAHCLRLGIDLVPNQNSFGHLRAWLAWPPLKPLAEVAAPYEGPNGEFLRHPSTLAPNHPGTLPFVCRLYDELLPNFSSAHFNVGCDETWDLGRGQSQAACDHRGRGRVYLEFLQQIHAAVRQRGRTMMFWGDIILHHPELIPELPRDVIALNWGYEAEHPFQREAALFARAKIPFYVCPGTSTWMTLIGKNDNALVNLRRAALAGRRHGARGYLITDWGDGGHPQPLAVSWTPILAGAALSWCAQSFREDLLAPVLSRDLFADPSGQLARAALGLGLAHRRLRSVAPNETPLGTVITAPPPEQRELFCRHGLTHFTRISGGNIRATLAEIKRQQTRLARARPGGPGGRILGRELKLAARLAALSCRYMLWQQAGAAGETTAAKKRAAAMSRELRAWDRAFTVFWPRRNRATPRHCTPFVSWRLAELGHGRNRGK
jgi:hypothetical protein